jgi:tetratricopeptide (TPR) repeat protein
MASAWRVSPRGLVLLTAVGVIVGYWFAPWDRQAANAQKLQAIVGRATVARERGDYAEAAKQFEEALKIASSVLDADDPELVGMHNNLANLYVALQRYAEAERHYERGARIAEAKGGLMLADVLNNWANLYQVQGKFASAEPLCQRSLAIREEILGPDDLHVAASLNNLAALYDSQRRHAEAEPLYLRSLRIKERRLGLDHLDVAATLDNLAMLYDAQKRKEDADSARTRSQRIKEANREASFR